MRIGRPIIIEKFVKVDHLGGLYLLRPGSVTTLRLGDDVHLRSRRNITVYGLGSWGARNKETRDVQASGWYPCPADLVQQFHLLILHEQLELILQIWNILEFNICMFVKMSGKDVNRGEAPHGLGRGL